MKGSRLTGEIIWQELLMNLIPSSDQEDNSTLSPGAARPQTRNGDEMVLAFLATAV
jgi:hypothetical protein